MRKALSFITALCVAVSVFSGCSFWGNGKSKEVEDVKKVPVSQIWDGIDALQGQDYGVIKLPDKIVKQENTDRLYAFTTELCEGDSEDLSRRFFKAFFGEGFDESRISTEDNNLRCDSADGSYAIFNQKLNSPTNAIRNGFERTFVQTKLAGEYYAEKDSDKVLNLTDGKCTVGEICDTLERFLAEGMPQYCEGDLIMKPYKVCYYEEATPSDGKPINYAEADCLYYFKGVPCDYGTHLYDVTIVDGFEAVYSYGVFHNTFKMLSKDEVLSYNCMTVPYKPEVEELTELIPLSNAVELLKNELAVKSRYVIDNICIRYCHKGVAPTTMDSQLRAEQIEKLGDDNDPHTVPTWCFEWTGYDRNGAQRNYIKVNAVTGEITLDMADSMGTPLEDESSEEETSSEEDDDSDEDGLKYPNIDELPEPVSYITVDAVSYKDSVFTYEYEGETKTVTMNFYALFRDASSIPTRIVNNSHGIKVKTVLGLDGDGAVVSADVRKLGGTFIDGMFGRERPDEKEWEVAHPRTRPDEATARRIKGSIYEISNENGSVTVDLNDLDYWEKCPYPDVVERVIFSAVQFESGETVLIDFCYLDDCCFSEVDDGEQKWTTSTTRMMDNSRIYLMYAGRIQSLTGDRAEIILNDGKTVVDVPAYYRDCELREGMNVFLAVEDSYNLWNDKKHWKLEFALITADPGKKEPGQPIIKDYAELDHSKIAYARRTNESMYYYNCVMTDEAL